MRDAGKNEMLSLLNRLTWHPLTWLGRGRRQVGLSRNRFSFMTVDLQHPTASSCSRLRSSCVIWPLQTSGIWTETSPWLRNCSSSYTLFVRLWDTRQSHASTRFLQVYI